MRQFGSVLNSAIPVRFAESTNLMKLQRHLGLVTAVFFCCLSASAEGHAPLHMNLSELVRFISVSCKGCTKNCRNGISRVELRTVSAPLNGRLTQLAHDQAQIWADTILEGDFVAEGPTLLGQVYRYSLNGQVVAYHITYSEKAWDVSDCTYDGLRSSQLANCRPGRIIESSFVSSDLMEAERDEKNYAHFVED